jgi:hypothetical protein
VWRRRLAGGDCRLWPALLLLVLLFPLLLTKAGASCPEGRGAAAGAAAGDLEAAASGLEPSLAKGCSMMLHQVMRRRAEGGRRTMLARLFTHPFCSNYLCLLVSPVAAVPGPGGSTCLQTHDEERLCVLV